jgi:5'-nucleotidase
MHILVSNDDGLYAPGIRALVEAVMPLGQVTVVAPSENQSTTGHKRTLHRPLRISPIADYLDGVTAYSVNGSPADCTAVAMLGFIKEPINLVVSGINRGANLAQDVTYSGTVAVALESAIFGVPAVAFSLDDHSENANYQPCIPVIRQVIEKFSTASFPQRTILNVNFPRIPFMGWKITRQGVREYRDKLVERVDPNGVPYYWVGGERPSGDVEEVDTDLWAVHHGYVSITPIHLDMTAHNLLPQLQEWAMKF